MKKINLIIITLLLLMQANGQTNKCQDILTAGFYNMTLTKNTGNFTSDVNHWLMSDNFISYLNKKENNFNILIPLDGVPFKFGNDINSENYKVFKNKFSQSLSSYNNSSFSNFVVSQIISEKVVEEWGKCMKINDKGLASYTEGENNYYVLWMKWNAAFGVNTVTLNNIYVKGAIYDKNILYKGRSIGTEYIAIPFERINREPIVIMIDTENGSIYYKIDLEGEEEISNLQKFENGDINEVIKAKKKLDQAINKNLPDLNLAKTDRFVSLKYGQLSQIKSMYRQVYEAAKKLLDIDVDFGRKSNEYNFQLNTYKNQLLLFESTVDNNGFSNQWNTIKSDL